MPAENSDIFPLTLDQLLMIQSSTVCAYVYVYKRIYYVL